MAWAANEPLKVEEIEVAPPQKGEVRVKVIANALVSRMHGGLDKLALLCSVDVCTSLYFFALRL